MEGSALERLRTAPGLALYAVLAVALGVGAASALGSVWVRARDSDRLVTLASLGADREHYRERSRSFETLGFYRVESGIAYVDKDFLELFPPPFLGRTLSAADEGNVAVASHWAWRERWASDPTIVGRSVEREGARVEVVGVLPPEFDRASAPVDLWVLRTEDDVSLERLGLGRLKPGVSFAQARAEIGAIALERGVAPPEVDGDGIEERDASVLGAIGLLALFAGPLVASLLLARGDAVRRERRAHAPVVSEPPRRSGHELVPVWAVGSALGFLFARIGLESAGSWFPGATVSLPLFGVAVASSFAIFLALRRLITSK